jgi:hypothetical protein
MSFTTGGIFFFCINGLLESGAGGADLTFAPPPLFQLAKTDYFLTWLRFRK